MSRRSTEDQPVISINATADNLRSLFRKSPEDVFVEDLTNISEYRLAIYIKPNKEPLNVCRRCPKDLLRIYRGSAKRPPWVEKESRAAAVDERLRSVANSTERNGTEEDGPGVGTNGKLANKSPFKIRGSVSLSEEKSFPCECLRSSFLSTSLIFPQHLDSITAAFGAVRR